LLILLPAAGLQGQEQRVVVMSIDCAAPPKNAITRSEDPALDDNPPV
jgi:hypothetical protein